MRNIISLVITWSFFITVAVGCKGCHHLKPPPMPITPSDSDMCPAACKRMAELQCPEAEPLADGTDCTTFCLRTQSAGHSLNPTCLATIDSCEQIEKCSVNREGGK